MLLVQGPYFKKQGFKTYQSDHWKERQENKHRKNPIVYYLDLGCRVVWEKDLRFRVKQTRVLVFSLPIYIIFL